MYIYKCYLTCNLYLKCLHFLVKWSNIFLKMIAEIGAQRVKALFYFLSFLPSLSLSLSLIKYYTFSRII